jgi:hypothetical protein
MSELDRELTALRADLHAALTPPDLTKVAGRARQRSVRRRMQIGAVAAVVVVSVVVPALRAVPSEPPGIPPFPQPGPTYQVDFADADHGYALRGDCEQVQGPCRYRLFATTDGGRRWEERGLPQATVDHGSAWLIVAGRTEITVDRDPMMGAGVIHADHSTDGGRTWSDAVPDELLPPTPIAPAAALASVCLTPGYNCQRGIGSTVDGASAPVPTQPPLSDPVAGGPPTEGGKHWAVGLDEAAGDWALSVTEDGGMTWSTSVLRVPGVPTMRGGWHLVERDGVMYTTVAGTFGVNQQGVLGVFRSTDGGVSWTRTFVGSPKGSLSDAPGSPVLTEDGRLLVYSASHGTFESADGVTFTRSAHQLPAPVTWTRGGYLVMTTEGSYELSTDGVTWRKFTVR